MRTELRKGWDDGVLFAQQHFRLSELSMIQWAILIVVIAGIVGIVLVCLRQFGIQIPDFIVKILWIILCVVVGVLAIKFVASML